jgi:hypothetical protein
VSEDHRCRVSLTPDFNPVLLAVSQQKPFQWFLQSCNRQEAIETAYCPLVVITWLQPGVNESICKPAKPFGALSIATGQ